MSLRLLPSKSWNVYSAKNRERVRRDEEEHARKLRKRAKQESENLFEVLRSRGRQRAGLDQVPADIPNQYSNLDSYRTSSTASKCTGGGQINRSKRRRIDPKSEDYMRREYMRKTLHDPMALVAAAKAAKRRQRHQEAKVSKVHFTENTFDSVEQDVSSTCSAAIPFWQTTQETSPSMGSSSNIEYDSVEKAKNGRRRSLHAMTRRRNKKKKKEQKRKKLRRSRAEEEEEKKKKKKKKKKEKEKETE